MSANFLRVIEVLSHFGHASLLKFCRGAKNLHSPAKKIRMINVLRTKPAFYIRFL